MDGIFTAFQATTHLRVGDAALDDFTTTAPQVRKRVHYVLTGHASFDGRSFELANLVADDFGRLGESGGQVADQVAIHTVGRLDGGKIAR